ncbi:MAG: hypothetical protein WD357_09450 [Gracilimonas sp.]
MIKRWQQLITTIFIFVLCFGSFQPTLLAQNDSGDEFEVYLDFRHRGVVNAVIISYYKNDEFFLPASELFSLFNIDHSVRGLIIDGRFGIEQIPYRINFESNQIRFDNETYQIGTDDYLLKELDSYIRAEVFYETFGLDFTIDFNNLTLNLETDRELPAIEQAIRRQRRQVADRNRFQQEKYEVRYDRERPFFDGGFVDYNLSSSFSPGQSVYNANTNLGIQLYGGDLQGTVFGSYSNNFSNFATNNLRWRYMYRDQPWLSKITIGQTTTDGFARNAYTGIRLTNEPIEPRRLFDEFEVQGSTIPQSEVELYMNNALIDFQQADELGDYRFLTPVTYGTSQLDLKIYGPTGQIIERSERIQVPFTFQPQGVFNYTVNAGRLDNPVFGETSQDLTAQGNGAYGITEWLTAKAGVEYYQGYHESLPTFTSSLSSRIASNYILTLEAATDAYYRGLLNVIYPNSASINFDYTDYTGGFGIYNPSNDDKRLVASVFYPFNFWGFPFNLRASTFSRIRSTANSTTFRLDANSRIGRMNLRVGYSDRYTGDIHLFNPSTTAFVESSATYNISRNRNLPSYLRGVFLRAQMRYSPVLSEFESANFLISQNVFQQGRFQLSYGRNFARNFNSLRFSLVVDLNKIRTSSTFTNIRGGNNFTQNLRGSMGYDSNYNNFLFTSRDQVGRSGAAIQLFVDNNADGVYNEGDDPITENAIRVQRSGAQSIQKNGVLYFTQMQPYFHYNIEMNKSAIRNPMLVPEFGNFGLITDPNRFKKVEIPFYMSGVIEGVAEREFTNGNRSGIGGLKIMLEQADGEFNKELRTFSDGSFYDYEVPPGNYTLTVDEGNMRQLGVRSVPEKIEFEVETLPDGDFVEGLTFSLVPTDPAPQQLTPITETETTPDTTTTEVPSTQELADEAAADSLDQTQITETVPQDTLTNIDPELITEAEVDTVQAEDNTDPEEAGLPVVSVPSVPVITPGTFTEVQQDSLNEEQALQDSLDTPIELPEPEQIVSDSTVFTETDTLQNIVVAPDSISIDTVAALPSDDPIAATDPDTAQTNDVTDDTEDTEEGLGLPVITPPVVPVPVVTPTLTEADGDTDSVDVAGQDSTDMMAQQPDSVGIDSSLITEEETLADNIPAEVDSAIIRKEEDPIAADSLRTVDPDPIVQITEDSLATPPAEEDSLAERQPIDDKDPDDVIAIAPPEDQTPATPDPVSEDQLGMIREPVNDFDAVPSAFNSIADVESLSPGRCIYGIQFASYFTEERSSRLSQSIEDDYLTYTVYNEPYDLFAVREIRYQSLSRAGEVAKEINSDTYFDAAVVSQCYADLDLNPEIAQYYIQLRQFIDSNEANSFIEDLNASYDMNSKVISQNQQDVFAAVLGPFDTERQAARQLNIFDDVPATENSVINRVTPPAKVINVDFEFMLLLEKFDTIENANTYVEENEDRLGEDLKVLIDENGNDYIVVSRISNSWSRIQTLAKEYSSSNGSEEPVILMVEKRR